jgi:hypothetical protein
MPSLNIQFDAQGKPFQIVNGQKSYLTPMDAAQYAHLFVTDPTQKAAVDQDAISRGVLTQDTLAKLTAYAQNQGVTGANPFGNRPDNMNGYWKKQEWDPTTGTYKAHMGAGIMGTLEGAAALAGPTVIGPMLAGSPTIFSAGAAAHGAGSTAATTAGTTSGTAAGATAGTTAGTTAGAAAPSFASRLKSLVTDPSKLVGLAAIIPSLARSFGGGGNSSGVGGDLSGIGDEITKNLAMQRQRMEQAQPAFDALVRQAYGQTPMTYRGQAPAGVTPNQAPSGGYAYQAPRFGGR